MKILYLNHNLIGRGSYLRCFPLARELVRHGHEVALVTTSDCFSAGFQSRHDSGVHVIATPRFGKVKGHDGGYAMVDILSRLPLSLKKWDVIHAFEHRPNVLIPALLGKFRGTPLVSDWSDWWTRGGITTSRRCFQWIDDLEGAWIEEGSKQISDAVTLVSESLHQRALEAGIAPDKLHLIPSGCDWNRIQPLNKAECRKALGLPQNAPVLCFSGFAFWDFEFLLKSFHEVLAVHPDAILAVIGSDKDGQIESLGRSILGELAGQTRLLGRFEPDRMSLPLGAADIHLLPLPDNPANRARWPIKFGDYLASGRPIVASRVGDAAPWLERCRAGLAVEPSSSAMAEAILELLANPPEMELMGANARALAMGGLSWEVMTSKMEMVYRCLAGC